LIQKARQISDKDERTGLYQQTQVIFKEEVPWVPLAHSMISQSVRREVKDFRIDPFGRHMFYGVDLIPRPTPLDPFLEERESP
jgi:dipeptide transport system substrate-binding protein